MSIMDSATDKMNDMNPEMDERMRMLTSKEQAGTLNDSDREELQQLRSRMHKSGGQ